VLCFSSWTAPGRFSLLGKHDPQMLCCGETTRGLWATGNVGAFERPSERGWASRQIQGPPSFPQASSGD
jgi:hypothetical protein